MHFQGMKLRLSLPLGAGFLAVLACGGSEGNAPDTPSPGIMRVSVSTTGPGTDPNGYTVMLDGGDVRTLAASDSTVFKPVPAGSHQVLLAGIDPLCTVSGQNPRPVTVGDAADVAVAFALTCVTSPAPLGAVRLDITTFGPTPDTDGYTYAIDGGTPVRIPVTGSVQAVNVPLGGRSIAVGDIAPHCHANGPTNVTVQVVAGPPAIVTLNVTCATNLLGFITYESDRIAPQHLDSLEIWAMRPDGTGAFRITTNTVVDLAPDVSPDGNKVAYYSGPLFGPITLIVANADASDPHPVASGQNFTSSPRWSPDGTRIAYSRSLPGAPAQEVVIMNADGSSPRVLGPLPSPSVNHRTGPAWSPDGTRVAIITDSSVNTIDADGSGEVVIVKGAVSAVDWSSTNRLALVMFSANDPANAADDRNEIFTVDLDGSNLQQLTVTPTDCCFIQAARWSPNGQQIVYTNSAAGPQYLYIISADGTGFHTVSATGYFNYAPSWR